MHITDRARKVMQTANAEAIRSNHEYLGAEHVLLGLLEEGSGVAAAVLKNLGLDLCDTRLEVERLVQARPSMASLGQRPKMPRAKEAVELAMQEARSLGHGYLGTEHLLLGLLRLQESTAGQALANLGLSAEQVRAQVLGALGQADPGPGPAVSAPPRIAPRPSLPRRLGQAWRRFWGN